jgi:hypothetical protein
MDVGDKLTRDRMRQAITDAEIAFGESDSCADCMNAAFMHLGPSSELAKLRRLLAFTDQAD